MRVDALYRPRKVRIGLIGRNVASGVEHENFNQDQNALSKTAATAEF